MKASCAGQQAASRRNPERQQVGRADSSALRVIARDSIEYGVNYAAAAYARNPDCQVYVFANCH